MPHLEALVLTAGLTGLAIAICIAIRDSVILFLDWLAWRRIHRRRW